MKMGATQSSETRKISIPNDGTHIRVSDSVIERLQKCQEDHPIGDGKDADKEKDKKKIKDKCPPDEKEIKVRRPNTVGDAGDAILNYYYGPSLTSLKILQEKEEELRETEKYWSRRIQTLEDHHANLSQVFEKEYNAAIKEIQYKLPKPKENAPQPCVDGRKQLMKCYQKHPNEILLCAGEVSAFANCVDSKRIS